MNEIIAPLVLTLALGAALAFHVFESRAWRRERASLLDRLMAKDWTELKQITGGPVASMPARLQLMDDEAMKAYAESQAS